MCSDDHRISRARLNWRVDSAVASAIENDGFWAFICAALACVCRVTKVRLTGLDVGWGFEGHTGR